MGKQKKLPRKVLRTIFKEDAGKILLDLGKLVFAGVFLGGLLQGGTLYDMMTIVGLAAAVVLMVAGFLLGIKKKNGESPQRLRQTSRIRDQKRRKT